MDEWPLSSLAFFGLQADHNELFASDSGISTSHLDGDNDSSSSACTSRPTPASESKNGKIVGPDGRHYTQGEAAKLGLIIRTACEACRNRKLKCSGTLPQNGGCERCKSDAIQCVYSARAPIGRPKKRKVEEAEDAASGNNSSLRTSPERPCCSRGRSLASSDFKNKGQSKKGKGKTKDKKLSNTSPNIKVESNEHSCTPESTTPQTLKASHPSQQSNCIGADAVDSSATSSKGSVDARFDEMSAIGSAVPCNPTFEQSNSTPWTAMLSSHSFTPQATMSPSVTSQFASPTNAGKLPSLDDLSVAAFLQSLDTLEISPEELMLQQQQSQRQLQHAQSSRSHVQLGVGQFGPLAAPNALVPGPSSGASSLNSTLGRSQESLAANMEAWTSSSAILQPGLSFAVPADFSWWDLGIIGADSADSAGPSTAAPTPAFEHPQTAYWDAQTPQQRVSNLTSISTKHRDVVPAQLASNSNTKLASPLSPSRNVSLSQNWPRGITAGMGQGQIQQTQAAAETGLGWSTLPSHRDGSLTASSPPDTGSDSVKSCCSAKAGKASVQKEPVPASYCSSKAKARAPSKTESCCIDKDSRSNGKAVNGTSPSHEKSCCNGKDDEKRPGLVPLSTAALSSDSDKAGHEAYIHTHSDKPSKVHCVPNPSGKGCTCLCDMSVALLSVKQVLRETDPAKKPQPESQSADRASSQRNSSSSGGSSKSSFASNTIQLTLTASQAITAQCACSTDCPTCQSDPSTEISASLLVSTALQIYARAVRTLREGFSSSSSGTSNSSVGGGYSSSSAANAFFGGLEVTIGSYQPSASNAKKIALFAIKLELKDLRRALGKISRLAQNFPSLTGLSDPSSTAETSTTGQNRTDELDKTKGMNPIDQLVILKLYRQLTELLKTVEGLEEVA
ncbi:hypothetical protein BCV70DRAFT_224979 [Testicularia cyperi]|uniref:Zn(2)-C6 fungal-type domain-containing protein n=1 Tax=Testicularia cyperi TaxID=1882483 RepID=A0A317XZT4_9BASI|nr:hypothetical protein BCV70DRAFT_224979 [Testicularia cyperi]